MPPELACFAVRERPIRTIWKSRFAPSLPEAGRRLLDRFVGQTECSPVHGQAGWPGWCAVDQRSVCGNRVFGIQVHVTHEPARLVGADRKHDEIECAQACADFSESRMQRRVPREEDTDAVSLYHPAAPQRLVAIADATCAEVLCGRARRREGWRFDRLPPVVLDGLLNSERSKEMSESQRTEPRRVGEPDRDAADGAGIQMIIVIV